MKENYNPGYINSQLKRGRSREELAEEFGHKDYKALDMFMRRKGYRWDSGGQCFEPVGVKPVPRECAGAVPGSKKVRKVLELFSEGKDAKEVAEEAGFKDHLVMANYMKEKGYTWSRKPGRFEPVIGLVSQVPGESQGDSREEEDRPPGLPDDGALKSIPRYIIPGVKISKSFHISNHLNGLLISFTEDKNISQRDFIELALVEAFHKHGYEAEIKGLIG